METGEAGEMEDGHKETEDNGVTVGPTVIRNVEEGRSPTGTPVFRGGARFVGKERRKKKNRDDTVNPSINARTDLTVRTSPVESQRPAASIPSPQTVEEPYYTARIGRVTLHPLPPLSQGPASNPDGRYYYS
jgi:hypothetical protein